MTIDKNKIYLYDSTLRDGAQTSTVNFGPRDKVEIAKLLDELQIDYIEAGWPGANKTDDNFFENLPKLENSRFSCFGMTRKPGGEAAADAGLQALINSDAKAVCIVGKSWDYHLKNALNITEEENFAMIEDSVREIVRAKKEAIFDAEHFFDGFKANEDFALKCIKTAYDAGARWVVLCDTNGGSLPDEIYDIVTKATKTVPGSNIGIHCHNDTGNAVANSLAAVRAGARQIQGTLNGLGERCGNANLVSLIPTLKLKLNYDIAVNNESLKKLTKISRLFDELIGRETDRFAPYVGEFAFAHKGGLHVSAVTKSAKSYEHIEPELVGNERKIMVSDQAGRSNIISRLKEIGLNRDDKIKFSKISDLVDKVKELEAEGYAYDSADASFELLAKKMLDVVPRYFDLIGFKSIDECKYDENGDAFTVSEATIKVKIDGVEALAVAEGIGPVNALDKALREVLSDKYPLLKDVSLTDYKVRILTPSDGTEAITRVQIESADKKGHKWTTIGVSANIVDASYRALYDSITFKLMKEGK